MDLVYLEKVFTLLTSHIEQTTSKLSGKTEELIVGSQGMISLVIPATEFTENK